MKTNARVKSMVAYQATRESRLVQLSQDSDERSLSLMKLMALFKKAANPIFPEFDDLSLNQFERDYPDSPELSAVLLTLLTVIILSGKEEDLFNPFAPADELEDYYCHDGISYED